MKGLAAARSWAQQSGMLHLELVNSLLWLENKMVKAKFEEQSKQAKITDFFQK